VKGVGQLLFAAVVSLLALAAVAPALIQLSSAIVLPVIVVAVALVVVRLVFFHTRRW
jgi:hypothetical protein